MTRTLHQEKETTKVRACDLDPDVGSKCVVVVVVGGGGGERGGLRFSAEAILPP